MKPTHRRQSRLEQRSRETEAWWPPLSRKSSYVKLQEVGWVYIAEASLF